MNETMKLYNDHLELMEKYQGDTMKEIEFIQKREAVLSDDSKTLIAKLMEHYSHMNTVIKCYKYDVEDFEQKIERMKA